MSHPANSIAPLPSFSAAPKDASAVEQLAAVVAAANAAPSEAPPATNFGGGGGNSAAPPLTPLDLGIAFSQPYPQLVPVAATPADTQVVSSYAPFFSHLPYLAYTDVRIDMSSTASFYSDTVWTGRLAVTRSGQALCLAAVQSLTCQTHFCLDADAEDFIPVSLFLPPSAPSPLPLTPESLHAVAAALRNCLLSAERVPPELEAAFSGCPHCAGCNTFAKLGRVHRSEHALALACQRAFAAAPPPELPEATLRLAHAMMHCPPLPTWAIPLQGAPLQPPTTTPQWPSGTFPALQGILHPALAAALQAAAAGDAGAALTGLLREEVPGWVYSFPLFTQEACEALLAVTEAHEAFCASKGVPVQRPNSMNRYGVILRSIGLAPFVSALTAAVLQPLTGAIFPLEGLQGGGCSSNHSFIVAYDAEEGKDRLLDMHTDDSE